MGFSVISERRTGGGAGRPFGTERQTLRPSGGGGYLAARLGEREAFDRMKNEKRQEVS